MTSNSHSMLYPEYTDARYLGEHLGAAKLLIIALNDTAAAGTAWGLTPDDERDVFLILRRFLAHLQRQETIVNGRRDEP